MKTMVVVLGSVAMAILAGAASASDISYKMKNLGGKEVDLAQQYTGKVLLIVNVASKCGLTPQYKEAEAFHEKSAKRDWRGGLSLQPIRTARAGHGESKSRGLLRHLWR